ncbi:helix-turn-helix domain-containing protein [Guptibacillus hwajinpoensis]|uniref:helix-turn-helix domain-containing protein n=1 Tax=Guptibacillus hwajinpoensis TaxID=208199 RepID=UPI001CFCDC47|nr:helix-turn-helix domain-containing protein [Pseudalkalibacillus hwajinpoensis]
MARGLLENEAELSIRQLHVLMQVSRIFNSSLDFYAVIQSVIEEAVSVIDAADGGVLFLYDDERKRLKVAGSTGFRKKTVNEVLLKSGESMTGLAFQRKETLHFRTNLEVEEAMKTMTPQNATLYHQSADDLPMSTICIPIMKEDSCTGVIVLDRFNQEKSFKEDDIRLVEAISSQAAIAIMNAELYRNKEASLQKLKQFNQTMINQNERLSKSVETHHALSDIGMNEGSFQEICSYLTKSIGKTVVIFDPFGEVTASSHKEWPSNSNLQTMIIKHLNTIQYKKHEVEVDHAKEDFLLFPLGRLSFPLGYLAIISESLPLTRFEHSAVFHACTVAGLQLMKQEAEHKEQQRLTGELLIHLLSTHEEEADLNFFADRLRTDWEDYFTVAVLDVPPCEQGHEEWMRSCIHASIRHLLHKNDTKLLVTEWGRQIVILFHEDRFGGIESCVGSINRFIQDFKELTARITSEKMCRIGIGKPVKGILTVDQSFEEAKKTIKFLERFTFAGHSSWYGEIGALRLLLNNNEDDLANYALEYLSPLLAYEKRRKGELFQTLFVYLSTGQDLKNASEQLHVHVNTMNYRIQRIQEILSINFNEPSDLMNIQVACTIYRYLFEA